MRKYYIEHKDVIKKNNREHYFANREKCLRKMKEWRIKNADRVKENKKRYEINNREKCRSWHNAYRIRHAEECRERSKIYARKIRLEVINAYGGKCACCGENRIPFLTLEHTNRDGAEHRRRCPGRVYYDLKKRGFPTEGYALLCWNCNCATKNGDVCPHKLTNGVSLCA